MHNTIAIADGFRCSHNVYDLGGFNLRSDQIRCTVTELTSIFAAIVLT